MEHEAAVMLIGGMTIFSLLMLFKSIVRYCCGNGTCGPVIVWILWGLFSVKLFLNGCAVLDNKEKSLSLDEQYEAAVKTENTDAEVVAP